MHGEPSIHNDSALLATPLALEWKANAALRTEIAQIRGSDPQLAELRTDADAVARKEAELRVAVAAQHTARLAAEIPATLREQFAVAQSLHLGTGMRTKTDVRPDGHGSVNMSIELPGLDWKF